MKGCALLFTSPRLRRLAIANLACTRAQCPVYWKDKTNIHTWQTLVKIRRLLSMRGVFGVDIVALIISLLFLLLTLVLLWLARRMRLKRPQVRELRAEHAALLDRQRAALEALRATDAQGQVGSLPEQQEPFLMPDSDQ